MKTTNIEYNKIKNLFLSQSYLDAWEDYQRSLIKTNFIRWDYVILTASNEAQAEAFRIQIDMRYARKLLPRETRYVVLPDPEGKRVGSGGATLNVLKYLSEDVNGGDAFKGKRILVIHSGGDSKRIPQYSAEGKLFSPVPRCLPNGRPSTLFDEFVIAMSGVAPRISEGMLVLSGDSLLLFNPLQIDAQFDGAAAISIKEPVFTGKDHGVFLSDGKGYVRNFLHKQTEETLRGIGAVNEHDAVDLDTGAILLSTKLLDALYSLISTNGEWDEAKFNEFVNDRARISFYGDFLYPLASDSTLEQFYLEKPEGDFTEELKECRKKLWKVLSPFSLKLICLSPARFIHFGTTRELRFLFTEEIQDYEFLDWKNLVVTNISVDKPVAIYNTYVGHAAFVDEHAYLENSYILGSTKVGRGAIVSNLKLRDIDVPNDVVLHGLPLKGGRYVARIYGVTDNPKGLYSDTTSYMKSNLKSAVQSLSLSEKDLWEVGKTHDLWNAKLFVACDTPEESVSWSLWLYHIVNESGALSQDKLNEYRSLDRISLCESFNRADVAQIIATQNDLENRILSKIFIDQLKRGMFYKDALNLFGTRGLTEEIYNTLLNDAEGLDFSMRIRIYYALSRYMLEEDVIFSGKKYDYPEELCFSTIKDAIFEESKKLLLDSCTYHIAKDEVNVHMPVRVNWGGGWTDTPPYCLENGGAVINAAISLNGILPIQICVKRLDELCVEFESQDVGVLGKVYNLEDIQDCHNPYDPFALHKAALIACGVVPLEGRESLVEILKRIGGGIYLSTQVVGIPKGSGLGTSSILAGACVKGIFEFMGIKKTDEEVYEVVLCMEQIMSTGGGWQDQVGGLTPGVKLVSSAPGIHQHIEVRQIRIPQEAFDELSERFALVYTGQRRLARNLLRDIIGGYIGARPESLKALNGIRSVAGKMVYYLESGDIDSFAEQLNVHWELNRILDKGSSNMCIDQIFVACEDLIDGKFIAGAGGGGFVMVILKKDVTREMLRERLAAIFQDSGVDVWECAFV